MNDSIYIGPENGTLVIVGGGGRIDSIMNDFIKLTGGNDAPIIVIPTAEGSEQRKLKRENDLRTAELSI